MGATSQTSGRASSVAIVAIQLMCCVHPAGASATAQGPQGGPKDEPLCTVDLSKPGMMSDILSNALIGGMGVPETRVRTYLETADDEFSTGAELLRAAAAEFGVSEADLATMVDRYHHVNCSHDLRLSESQLAFATNVTLHVVLHELAHALVREFDLPVLGNEETLADAFATHYLTTHLPHRAVDVLQDRVESLMMEAEEVPREQWGVRGEHNNDARRAYQILALVVAKDAETYGPLATRFGMTDGDIRQARDYGAEIHRSWRRILAPLWMPDGESSTEVRVRCDPESRLLSEVCARGLIEEIESVIRRFDWHSQVTVHIKEGDGRAGWSRSKRTITVNSAYIRRFVEQGARISRP